MPATADDKLIWDLTTGSRLTASRDMLMEHTGDRVFTAGMTYKVESMHPIADPPFVRVVDDQSIVHQLVADDLRTYFGR